MLFIISLIHVVILSFHIKEKRTCNFDQRNLASMHTSCDKILAILIQYNCSESFDVCLHQVNDSLAKVFEKLGAGGSNLRILSCVFEICRRK